jgi:hypothetical protein
MRTEGNRLAVDTLEGHYRRHGSVTFREKHNLVGQLRRMPAESPNARASAAAAQNRTGRRRLP